MQKVLIIKLGYSETLDQEIGITTSLGDVLRTTVILNYFKNDAVTWLVDEKAYPLLKSNPYINRILIFNLETVLQLQRERFDAVINLEKGPGICAFSDSINAWRRFGFRFDEQAGSAQSYDGAERVLSLCLNIKEKKENKKYWQEVLAEMIEKRWNKEGYILGYKSGSRISCDVGFNWVTGQKWNNKAWPKPHWEELGRLLEKKYSISWQKGLENLYEYMDWIHSCRMVVTNDSLGMHLAIAFNKKLIVFFGPSSSQEVYLYDLGKILTPKTNYSCVPCLKRDCYQKKNCLYFIQPKRVALEIERLMKA